MACARPTARRSGSDIAERSRAFAGLRPTFSSAAAASSAAAPRDAPPRRALHVTYSIADQRGGSGGSSAAAPIVAK